MPTSNSKNLSASSVIAIACFFTTGVIALTCEICWIRKASLVFGATTLAVSTVIGIYFAGLALGSYLSGIYSRRTNKPMKAFAIIEICLGLIILLHPAAFSWTERLYGTFYGSVANSFVLTSLARLVLVGILILPPATLMGATLPLFARQYVTDRKAISLSVGLLYGINTLGAAVGCAAAGFYLIPHLGVNRTIMLGGLVNIIVGIIAGIMKMPASHVRSVSPASSVVQIVIPVTTSASLSMASSANQK